MSEENKDDSVETTTLWTESGLTLDLMFDLDRVHFTGDVKFQPLHRHAHLPVLGSENAAGYDLCAVEDTVLGPGEILAVPLGFATEMPKSLHCRIESRSGMALSGYVVLTGVIDADYRGEWKVILMNTTKEALQIAAGKRIAQAVFRPTVRASFREVENLTQTDRGAGGFGSTGA